MLQHQATSRLPTAYGVFDAHVFSDPHNQVEVMALTQLTHIQAKPLVRIHSACATGDLFHSIRCDCGPQLTTALQLIQKEEGLLIYLPQEGRGIGLANKIKAYALQDTEQLDTVEANVKLGLPIDSRHYDLAFQILRHFHLHAFHLLTNNPLKMKALEEAGFDVQRRALVITPSPENQDYLRTKSEKLGHLL